MRKLRTNFGRREAPSAAYVRYLVRKVKETDIVFDKPKTVCKIENIASVAESVCEVYSTSIHRRSQQLNISETSLHKNLSMTPYKVHLVKELKPIDHPMHFSFTKWACDQLTEDADFGKKKSFHFR